MSRTWTFPSFCNFWTFWLKLVGLQRKRKRKIADFLNGTIGSPLSESFLSNSGFDMTTTLPLVHEPMPEVKRKRSLSRMTSAISTPMAKMTSVLQRSLSSAKLHGCPSPHKGTPTRYRYRWILIRTRAKFTPQHWYRSSNLFELCPMSHLGPPTVSLSF